MFNFTSNSNYSSSTINNNNNNNSYRNKPHLDKAIKILVLGDAGVGKTSLLRAVSYKGDLPNNNKFADSTTVGCNIEVYLHTNKNSDEHWDVELWDVAGNSTYRKSKSLFYSNCNGILLVHDLTNSKSYYNLDDWVTEALTLINVRENLELSDIDSSHNNSNSSYPSPNTSLNSNHNSHVSPGSFNTYGSNFYNNNSSSNNDISNLNIPIFIVGTKMDVASDRLPIKKSFINEGKKTASSRFMSILI